MAAPRSTHRSGRAPSLAPRALSVAALLATSGCLASKGPGRLAPGTDLVRPESSLAGAVRKAVQRCDGLTETAATGDKPDRCGRATTDTVRAAPDTMVRVPRVP